jgi:hypothetical protein
MLPHSEEAATWILYKVSLMTPQEAADYWDAAVQRYVDARGRCIRMAREKHAS